MRVHVQWRQKNVDVNFKGNSGECTEYDIEPNSSGLDNSGGSTGWNWKDG